MKIKDNELDDKGREENRLPKIREIPLTEIDEFPDHPYQVRMDEDMDQLVESIKERGIITPVTLRKKEDGRYAHIIDADRKVIAEKMEATFFSGSKTKESEGKQAAQSEVSSEDRELIMQFMSNPQAMPLLKSLAKAF